MLACQLPLQIRAKDGKKKEVRIFTIGAPESAEKRLTAYIEAVRRSKPENDG